jgi:putative tricarboxylic transport membrane protein
MILLFCLLGVYSLNMSAFEMLMVVVFGLVGYGLRKLDYEMAPLILGVVLGPLLEVALRQSLLLSRGSLAIFVTRPIAACFLVVAAVFLVRTFITWVRTTKSSADVSAGSAG